MRWQTIPGWNNKIKLIETSVGFNKWLCLFKVRMIYTVRYHHVGETVDGFAVFADACFA